MKLKRLFKEFFKGTDSTPFQKVSDEQQIHKFYPLIPSRQTSGSAGYDFHLQETITIEPQQTVMTFSDIKCELKPNEVLLLFIRSSIGTKYHVALANGTGVIDSDYFENPDNDGNIGLPLYNYGSEPVTLKFADRVAQGVIVNFEAYGEVIRERVGGFGSSGK